MRVARNAISPQHSSMLGRKRAPYGFGEFECTHEQREALERVAIDTFTDMVNQGNSFQAALAAVYFSGFIHALEGARENANS